MNKFFKVKNFLIGEVGLLVFAWLVKGLSSFLDDCIPSYCLPNGICSLDCLHPSSYLAAQWVFSLSLILAAIYLVVFLVVLSVKGIKKFTVKP